MKKNKEKKLIILIIILIVIIILVTATLLITKLSSSKNKIIEIEIGENKIAQNITYDTFEITNTTYQVDEENNNTKILLTIKNTSNKTKYLKSFEITIKDNNGNKLDNLIVNMDRNFEKNEQINTFTGTDLVISKASSLEFNFK